LTKKQAIHPNQVDIIQRAYAPSEKGAWHSVYGDKLELRGQIDILKAARVAFSFEHNDGLGKGAYTLDGAMIDAPVYKQVAKVIVIEARGD
jgi:citrate lyase subunit beta-like protein